jgi:hypothetical protein
MRRACEAFFILTPRRGFLPRRSGFPFTQRRRQNLLSGFGTFAFFSAQRISASNAS